jgi:hypothetical protein
VSATVVIVPPATRIAPITANRFHDRLLGVVASTPLEPCSVVGIVRASGATVAAVPSAGWW